MSKRDKLPSPSKRLRNDFVPNWPVFEGPCAWCPTVLTRGSHQPFCVDCLGRREMCVFIVDQMDRREEMDLYERWRSRLQQLMGFAFGLLSSELKLRLADHCCELGLVHGYNGNWWHVYRTEDLPPLFLQCGLRIPQAQVLEISR